jgi:hypothetical protein
MVPPPPGTPGGRSLFGPGGRATAIHKPFAGSRLLYPSASWRSRAGMSASVSARAPPATVDPAMPVATTPAVRRLHSDLGAPSAHCSRPNDVRLADRQHTSPNLQQQIYRLLRPLRLWCCFKERRLPSEQRAFSRSVRCSAADIAPSTRPQNWRRFANLTCQRSAIQKQRLCLPSNQKVDINSIAKGATPCA